MGDGYKRNILTAVDGIVGDVFSEKSAMERGEYSPLPPTLYCGGRWLFSSEGLVKGKRFTGAMIGIYVEGIVSGIKGLNTPSILRYLLS